jgi:hypothetical protein
MGTSRSFSVLRLSQRDAELLGHISELQTTVCKGRSRERV